jgi:hypothetical protein
VDAAFTGFKPDPDADAKLATVMPWVVGGLVTDMWGLEARRVLATAGIPNSAAIGKSRAITWANFKKKLAEATVADADGVLNWRPADDPQPTVVVPLSWARPRTGPPTGPPKPPTRLEVTDDELATTSDRRQPHRGRRRPHAEARRRCVCGARLQPRAELCCCAAAAKAAAALLLLLLLLLPPSCQGCCWGASTLLLGRCSCWAGAAAAAYTGAAAASALQGR